MTKRDFFRILIKVFTLYSVIISIFTLFPQLLSFNQMLDNITLSLVFVGCVLVLVAFSVFMVKFTDKIIDFLKLDKGFDEESIVLGNLNNQAIFKISIILIGGFMIVDNFSQFLMDILNEFKFKSSYQYMEGHEVDYFWFGVRFLNLIFGYLIISNCKSIAKFLDKN